MLPYLIFSRKKKIDIVVLDINMPNGNVLDMMKHIRTAYPGLQTLILSVFPEEQYAIQMLKAGAAGYLSKDSAPQELIGAIRKVADGKKYVSESLAEYMARELEVGDEEKRS